MYQLHYKPDTTYYCLRNGDIRTCWLPSILETLKAPLNMPVGTIPFGLVLLYSGPTIPTIDTHPEFFI